MNLRRLCAFLALAACVALATNAVAGPISVGNLVVVQANGDAATGGTTATAIASSAQPQFVKEFSTAGALQQTIILPQAVAASGDRAINIQGNATSEGFIAQSVNGDWLTVTGYNKVLGGTTPASDTAATTNRVVGRIKISDGTFDTTTALTDAYNGSNIRSSVTIDGVKMYTAGNAGSGQGTTGGVRFLTHGGTTSLRINDGAGSGSNSRVVDVYGAPGSGGQLYTSASSSPRLGIQSIGTGVPETAGQPETTLNGMPISGTHSNYDYWFMSPSTVYIADDGGAGTGGGIQKWTLNSGLWSLQYILLSNAPAGSFVGTQTTGVRGLTGFSRGGTTTLYATTSSASANNLISIVDLGAGGGTATVLATAPVNTAFRGVDYINVPEPASIAIVALAAMAMIGLIRRR